MDPISAPLSPAPLTRPAQEPRTLASAPSEGTAPVADRAAVSSEAVEPDRPDPSLAALQGGLAANFGDVPPAQGLDVDMERHTQARLAHVARQINSPDTSGAERRELLREQAALRSGRAAQPPGTTPPGTRPGMGEVLDGVQALVGDQPYLREAQEVRRAYNDPALSSGERSRAIGEAAGGAAGRFAGQTAGGRAGMALGARAGLTAGAAAGALGGPAGAFAGALGGAAIGAVGGWWAGGRIGGALGEAAGRPAGRTLASERPSGDTLPSLGLPVP